MTDRRAVKLTPELLQDISIAALANASELLVEASVLYEHRHFARAYFLAVAAIEETGKAYLAFDGRGRQLSHSAVASRLKRAMEDHRLKISSAFVAWLTASPNVREAVMPAVTLMRDLRHGREPSMYTDIHHDSPGVQIPSAVIRERAAGDCIRLARGCLLHTQRYIAQTTPEPRTRAQDQLFAMKTKRFQKIANTPDFWWYYVAQLEAGQQDFAEAVVSYQNEYGRKGVAFRQSSGQSDT